MAVYRGCPNPTRFQTKEQELRAFGSTGEALDQTLKELSADGWFVRQMFQEVGPMGCFYRIFAQRTTDNNKRERQTE